MMALHRAHCVRQALRRRENIYANNIIGNVSVILLDTPFSVQTLFAIINQSIGLPPFLLTQFIKGQCKSIHLTIVKYSLIKAFETYLVAFSIEVFQLTTGGGICLKRGDRRISYLRIDYIVFLFLVTNSSNSYSMVDS